MILLLMHNATLYISAYWVQNFRSELTKLMHRPLGTDGSSLIRSHLQVVICQLWTCVLDSSPIHPIYSIKEAS